MKISLSHIKRRWLCLFKHNPHEACSISSPFGPRDIGTGYTKFHKGIDIRPKIRGVQGDALFAACDGIVKCTGINQGGVSEGYGYYIIIEHESFCTLYGHIKALDVKEGQLVKAGDIVAHMGNTGHSTGCHCHFEVRLCKYPNYWQTDPVDPAKYLRGDDNVTKEEAIKIIIEKAGLSESTMEFLGNYKYAESLFIKLAEAMK
ncbi:MAG: M23 family metallopeptidase [Mariniphaga sp.]